MNSIRAKLVLGMAINIILLIILGVSSFYSVQKVLSGLDEVLEEALVEAIPVMQLESLLGKASMPANDYLVHGRRKEIKEFAEIELKTEKMFAQVMANTYDLAREKKLLQEAKKEWHIGRLLSKKILSIENPKEGGAGENVDSGDLMEQMDAAFERASAHIDWVFKEMVNEGAIHAGEAYKNVYKLIWLITGVFIVGLALLLFLGIVIFRSIIHPMNLLHQGVKKFGDGAFDLMVDIKTDDEIGEIAFVFNQMAQDIKDFSSRDGLTGILERKELNRRMLEEIQRAKRYKHTLAFLMIDIDRFSRINDEFGHLAGDEVLVSVAKKISESLRPGDQISRYGGDEIAVVFPETSLDGATIAAGRIREKIERETFKSADGRDIRVTVSIGLAVYPINAIDETNLVSEAAEAVHAAKKSGRNVVVSSDARPE